jgi:hypothetical protein
LNRHEFIDWFEDVRAGTRRLISMVPEEAFDFRAWENGPTLEQVMRAFAGLESRYVRGVCTGDWSDPGNLQDVRRQMRDAFAEEADDPQYFEDECELQTVDEILDRLDQTHQESLDILADLTDEEFQNRRVDLPWGEQGTIMRLLLGLVEREIHHRTELYLALQQYGVTMHPMMLWGP